MEILKEKSLLAITISILEAAEKQWEVIILTNQAAEKPRSQFNSCLKAQN